MPPDFPAVGLVGAGGVESALESFGGFAAAFWSDPALDEVLGGGEVSLLVVRCGAGGSGAGACVLAGSAGRALSTRPENPPLVRDGSGWAAFGGAT